MNCNLKRQKKYCIDCTVVSPIKATNPVAIQVRQAAEVAEAKKYPKHLAACESAGYGFFFNGLILFNLILTQKHNILEYTICINL